MPIHKQRDIELVPASTDTIASSRRNVIAVIGIDRYASWPLLTNAVHDATGVASLFQKLGFEQIASPLLDKEATGKRIWELVKDDLKALGPDDSLVLFYAGHSGTRTHRVGNKEVKTGHLIPVDASDKAATWIELEDWLRAVSLLPARHILVILDGCYSGIALGPIMKWRGVGSKRRRPLVTLNARCSRRVITSALDDEVALDSGPLPDHSLFTGCLIEALTTDLPQTGAEVVTGTQLGLHVQQRVRTYPGAEQTPDFGAFDHDERGEIVIPIGPEPSFIPLPPARADRGLWIIASVAVAVFSIILAYGLSRDRESSVPPPPAAASLAAGPPPAAGATIDSHALAGSSGSAAGGRDASASRGSAGITSGSGASPRAGHREHPASPAASALSTTAGAPRTAETASPRPVGAGFGEVAFATYEGIYEDQSIVHYYLKFTSDRAVKLTWTRMERDTVVGTYVQRGREIRIQLANDDTEVVRMYRQLSACSMVHVASTYKDGSTKIHEDPIVYQRTEPTCTK